MESGILKTIEIRLIEQIKLEKDLAGRFIEAIKGYKKGDYLYHEVFERKFNIDSKIFSRILNLLVQMEVVERVYQVYCPYCQRILDPKYTSLRDLEETIICEECDSELLSRDEMLKYIVVLFRLMRDE